MRSYLCLFGAATLSGCSLWGPDYQEPQNQAPGAWRSQDAYAKIGAERIPEMAWWNKFRDPLLQQLVDKALERNNNIQSAVGGVYKAKAILQQIEMNWVPTVNLGAGYMSTQHDRNDSTYTTLPFPGAFSAGFVPNYSLNILQQLRNQEQAEANIASAVAAKNAVRLAIIGQVTGSYFSLREEEYRLEQQRQLVRNLQEVVAKYSEAHRAGLISLFTLQQYEVELAKANAEIPVIEYNIVRLSNAIHVLLNENPGTIPPGQPFMDLQYKGIVTGNLPSTVLKNRPDVIHAAAVLKQANANIGVNTAIFFPTVKLTTPLGLASNSLSNLFTAKDSYWQYQGGINMPILNLGAFGAIKSAKAQYYADFFAYQETVKTAFAAVDSDLSSHQKYTDSLDRMLAFYGTTDQRYRNEQLRHQEGLVGGPQVLALRVTLNQAAIMTAQSKLAQLLSIVTLYQDLGGGYQYKNNETVRDLGDGHRFGDLF
ncbi:efflux transporter outer membrane subunit [Methylotetracoccus oryzae]|uniref:efflux transporter outer membrane subunit n=1 Tax=Methylotetracoccus oryzae TaxID=1919059 RepID=UPI001118E584|nr:efflux transporter outer membrane subunit [Methylotetracoccus oryzae]